MGDSCVSDSLPKGHFTQAAKTMPDRRAALFLSGASFLWEPVCLCRTEERECLALWSTENIGTPPGQLNCIDLNRTRRAAFQRIVVWTTFHIDEPQGLLVHIMRCGVSGEYWLWAAYSGVPTREKAVNDQQAQRPGFCYLGSDPENGGATQTEVGGRAKMNGRYCNTARRCGNRGNGTSLPE